MTTYEIIKSKIIELDESLLTVVNPDIKNSLENMKQAYITLAIKELRKDE